MKLGTWWASAAARILLMLGLAYASVWWSYQRFYAMFAVAPQDVGLVPNGGLSDIVGAVLRLGAWLTIALLALAVLPVIAVSAAGYIIERRPKRMRDIDVRIACSGIVGLVAAGAAIAGYWWLLGKWFAVAAAVVGVAATVAWAHALGNPEQQVDARSTNNLGVEPAPVNSCGRPPPAGQRAHDQKMPIRFRDWRTRRDGWPLSVFNVFAVVAVIGLLFFDLPDDAADAANCARGAARQAVRGIGAPWSGAHLILLDVQAQPATITWISGHAPTGASPALFPALYLGTANGWVVVYRKFRDHPKVLRLPASGVVVNITADTETCKSAH